MHKQDDELELSDDELLEPPELDEEGPDELLDENPLEEELECELDDDELLGPPEEELLSDEELLEIGGILDDEELGELLLELDRLPLLLELIDRYLRSVERIQMRPVLRHKGAMSIAKSDDGVNFSQNSVPHELRSRKFNCARGENKQRGIATAASRERFIKQVAIGRKDWLFISSVAAGAVDQCVLR